MHISRLNLGNINIILQILFYVLLCLPQIVLFQKSDPTLLVDPVHLILTGISFLSLFTVFFYTMQYILKFLPTHQIHFTKGWAEFLLVFWCICGAIPIHEINSTDMNGFSSDIDYINLFINLMLSTVIFYILRQEVRKLLFPAICFTTVLFFVSNQYNFISEKNKYQRTIQLGSTNTIVFSFDGIPGRIFNRISTLPDNARNFNDFVLYENAFSHSPATLASMHSEIFGGSNWKLSLKTESDLRSFAQSALKQKKFGFLETGFTYGYYENFTLNKNNILKEGFVDLNYSHIQSVPILSTSFCRIGVCILGQRYGWFANYVRKFKFLDGLIARAPMESRYTSWADAVGTPGRFDVDPETKYGAFWGHYMFSHHPIWQNELCAFDVKFDRPNVRAVNDQTKCVISVINTVLDELRQYDFYEDSLIVFKSDHGKPRQYYDKQSLYGSKINDHPSMGFDRYRPFVMIKYPESDQKKLTVETNPFFLSDLSLIYCTQWQQTLGLITNNCSNTPTAGKSDAVDNQKYFFIPKSKNSSFRYDTHRAYPVQPTVEDIETLFKSLSDLEQ